MCLLSVPARGLLHEKRMVSSEVGYIWVARVSPWVLCQRHKERYPRKDEHLKHIMPAYFLKFGRLLDLVPLRTSQVLPGWQG